MSPRLIDCVALPCRHRGPKVADATTCREPSHVVKLWVERADGTAKGPDWVARDLEPCPRGER